MESDRPGSGQIFGIHELYRPKTGEPDLDIVAVHGLNGDALKTWTCEPGLGEKGSGINWLAHESLLPRYLPSARVLTWGYNANISSLKGKETSSDRILQHAQTLVAQLSADRELEGMSEKPIIFLCHSLGGIVAKRALAYSASRTAPKLAHLHSIYTCTYAILFFGTPHMGASKARLLGSLQKLALLAIPQKALQTESSLINALEEESETLQNITDQFAPLMSNFHIFFFWEQEKTDLKYTKDYIVDEASAAPIIDNTERSGIAADHRGICRFKKSSDQGFRTVMSALRRYNQQASDVIIGRSIRASNALNERRWHEATELVKGAQVQSQGNSTLTGGLQNSISYKPSLLPRDKIDSDGVTSGKVASQEESN